MKQLRSGAGRADWDNELIGKLGFIKQKLRYPISRYTILPAAAIGMLLPGISLLIFLTLAGRHADDKRHWPQVMMIAFLLLAGFIAARRYWQTLNFKAIPTPYFSTDNQIILQRFLQDQHLAFARHPEAPEVFQIMSKNISALKEEREIIVFIADDRRILINSHFTQTGTNFAIGTPHHLQMAGMLQAWMNAGGRSTNTNLERSVF